MRKKGDPFSTSQKAEHDYTRMLLKVAREVGNVIRGFAPGGFVDSVLDAAITSHLTRYADVLIGWAETVGNRMILDVDRRDAKAWMEHSVRISKELRREVEASPVGFVLRERLADQVHLIRSLPIEAAQRVHKLSVEGLIGGRRADVIAQEIRLSGHVTASRARTIARTEVARTSSLLTQARAESIGSPGYTWKTSRDEQVRPSHRGMQGKLVMWSDPPTLDGMTGHAGCFPNCRCHPYPILPEI